MSEQTGRAKNYIKCWNCDGYIGKSILQREEQDDVCPLCGATELSSTVTTTE